ncbi:MAG: hypothetical protein U9N19_02545 [Thermodesulfobacteriota bacterium]|nr:hypothetical protein [Thermodesulfobacteriota bacterium]
MHAFRISLKELRETQRWLKLIQRVPLNVRYWIFVFSFDVGRSMFDVRRSSFNMNLLTC